MGLSKCCQGLSHLYLGLISMHGLGLMSSAVQSVTIYSSEVSPPQYRGALNMLFQWCTTFGIIIAQLVNYGTQVRHLAALPILA